METDNNETQLVANQNGSEEAARRRLRNERQRVYRQQRKRALDMTTGEHEPPRTAPALQPQLPSDLEQYVNRLVEERIAEMLADEQAKVPEDSVMMMNNEDSNFDSYSTAGSTATTQAAFGGLTINNPLLISAGISLLLPLARRVTPYLVDIVVQLVKSQTTSASALLNGPHASPGPGGPPPRAVAATPAPTARADPYNAAAARPA